MAHLIIRCKSLFLHVFDTQISGRLFKMQLDLCAVVILRSLLGRALPTELMAH